MRTLQNRASLGNPARRWRQTSIPVTTFQAFPSLDRIDDVARLAKEAGFTVLEFLKQLPPEALDAAVAACEKYDLGFLLEDWRYWGAFQDACMAPWTPEKLAEGVARYTRSPNLFGYYVWDEPYPGQFPLARRVIDQLERLDPARLPFTVALPSYNERYRWDNGRYEEYLTEYFRVIQPPVVSLDYYPFFFEARTAEEMNRSHLFDDIGLLRRISLAHDTPLWFYFQCWRHSAGDPPMTAEMTRMQFYNALLHGAKGMQWFIIFDYIITHSGQKGYLFSCARQLNTELHALESTLLALTSERVYHGGLTDCRFGDDLAADPLLCAVPAFVSVGTFGDGYGNRYAMVLNRNFEAELDVALPLRQPRRIYRVSRQTGAQEVYAQNAQTLTLHLAAGDAELFRLEAPEGAPEPIRYTL